MVYLLAILAGLLGNIVGGLLPFHPKVKNISTRYLFAFAAGTITAAAFFGLLPEANVPDNWLFLGIGFFAFYTLEKGLGYHTCGETECEIRGVSWVTVLGMASDNIVDGIGIGTAFAIRPSLGVIIMLVVIFHEVPQGMAMTVIMKMEGRKLRWIIATLALAVVMYVIGAAISGFIPENFRQGVIAAVAGVFIYIGASALLGEAHKRFNYQVIATLLIGAGFVLALKFLE